MSDTTDLDGDFDPNDALPETWNEFLADQRDISQLMQLETPRGAGVLARAWLEGALDNSLTRVAATGLPATTGFHGVVNASDISRKITTWCDYAQAPARLRREMHQIRLLGRKFAHQPRADSFEHPEIVPIMAELAQATVDKNSEHLPPGSSYRPTALGKITISLALNECIAHILQVTTKATTGSTT